MRDTSRLTYSYKDFIDSPEGLADRIAESLGCPVTIEDANHRIISYSKHETNVDDARTATIMRRKVPEQVINGLWKHGIMSKLFESDQPLIVEKIEEIGLGNRLAISVHKNKELLGFIWAQTNDLSVTSEHLEEIKEAAQWVSHHLLRQQAKKKKTDENRKEFFWQLLTGSLENQSEIKRLAKKYQMNLQGQLCVAVFEFKEEMSQAVERHAYYLTETLHQTRIVNRIFDDQQLILLVRTDDQEDANEMNQAFIREFTQKMKERLHFEDLKGAFGLIYDSPTLIGDSYKQALKVLELKEQYPDGLHHVDNYQDLGVYQFINELAALQKKENYKNDALRHIKAYDDRNKSMLLETLKVFLEKNSNVHQAAAHMHIHTNTLNYRLKRIKEIGNIDFKDVNQKTMLYLDLLIYESEQEDL
ncbi:DNA-binding transcriptional regulator, PucR family [Halobacillus karajensis]|uniref:Carbohydrate diacid transcriptional activator CdaR n=1 Tax=Halobacillus karajensis TaxID=195088 RepID=A0A024P3T7_9BACI|nr:helix-turn-helix domain-containing protein [Halobacillus karajensis]CDQ19146.1 carbohydrate diacid transcriptional activator CdaR [Halobacillus karajensis]CDQ22780.1 carbohydrate diacid transcriptional activator CdaR [Halobacillus karajensis]CDQ26262.1 carbohydrate diacid transcriptional activator CdaR [Halobacillus karajensis]SEH40915.1 DNA-binding transcriptional regulator, PucR family [Halobacillus karajensis]